MIKFFLLNIIGSTLYALGIHSFTAPQQIAPGGASGIAIIVNYLTDFPMGQFTFLFNIPLLIFAYKQLTKRFVWNALMSITLFSIITDYVVVYFPIYKGDMLLAAVFGGALMGIGLGIVHISGSTTGGLSILGLLLQKKYPQFEVGTLLFCLNFLVVSVSGFVFNNIETVLYATITIFINSKFMDNLVEHLNNNKFIVIISDNYKKAEIEQKLMEKTSRGITILKGEGGYSKEEKQIVFCAARKVECPGIRKMIKDIDPQVFIIVAETSEVVGNGFRHLL